MSPEPRAVAARLADEVSVATAQAIAAARFFSIALAGESLRDAMCFPTLVAAAVSWSKAHFFWADERAVPASDPESNYGLADRLWLTPRRSRIVGTQDAADRATSPRRRRVRAELMRVLGVEAGARRRAARNGSGRPHCLALSWPRPARGAGPSGVASVRLAQATAASPDADACRSSPAHGA